MKRHPVEPRQTVAQRRRHPGKARRARRQEVEVACLGHFAVSADTIDPDRANVYEAWTDAHSLETFRGSGPDDPSFAFIVRADVERHEISHSGPP